MGSVVDYDVRIASLLEGLEALPKSLVLFETAYPAKLFDRLGTIFPSIQDSDLRNKILKDYYVGVQGSEGRISWPVYLNGVQMLSKAFQAARNDGKEFSRLNLGQHKEITTMVPKLVLSFSDTYKRGPSELDQAVSFKIQENIHNLYTRLKDHNPLPMLETLRTNTETQQPETLKFVGFEDGSVQLSHHRPPAFQKDLSNLYMSAKKEWERHRDVRERLEDEYSIMWTAKRKKFESFAFFKEAHIEALRDDVFKSSDLNTLRAAYYNDQRAAPKIVLPPYYNVPWPQDYGIIARLLEGIKTAVNEAIVIDVEDDLSISYQLYCPQLLKITELARNVVRQKDQWKVHVDEILSFFWKAQSILNRLEIEWKWDIDSKLEKDKSKGFPFNEERSIWVLGGITSRTSHIDNFVEQASRYVQYMRDDYKAMKAASTTMEIALISMHHNLVAGQVTDFQHDFDVWKRACVGVWSTWQDNSLTNVETDWDKRL